jgi:hypothetical protein
VIGTLSRWLLLLMMMMFQTVNKMLDRCTAEMYSRPRRPQRTVCWEVMIVAI